MTARRSRAVRAIGRAGAERGRIVAALLVALAVAGCGGSRLPDVAATTPLEPAAATASGAAATTGAATAGDSAPLALAATAPRAPVSLFTDAEPEPRAYAAIVVDARSGRILHEEDAEGLRYPASLTKMMTLYLLFDAIAAGRYDLGSPLTVSAEAASRPPAKLGVKPGDTITVDQAIRAMAVRSSNDVAVVVAENVGGSEAAFVEMMNRRARSLGMSRTRFYNPSGLPHPRQVTTARDMAILARAIMTRHRRYRGYFTLREWTYEGKRIRATNKLLGEVPGVNGVKTGYIRLSGFNLATSVEREGRFLIVVVFGGKTGRDRDQKVEALIEEWLPSASRARSPVAIRG